MSNIARMSIPAERLAAILGLPRSGARAKPGRLADLIRAGLPVASFEHVSRYTNLGRRRLAALVSISERTLDRRLRLRKRFEPDESDRLARVARVFVMAEDEFGSRAAAERWMDAPNRSLDGARPIDFLDTELTSRDVEDLLGGLRSGVFG